MHDHDANAREWDDFYTAEREGAPIWSGQPNGALLAEVADLTPGTALDVGCGEGADAVWLARRGWQVTGLDPSQIALDRARGAAREADVEVRWVRAGLLDAPGGLGRHDLVSVQYPAIARSEAALGALLEAVAPGGTLLFVHHDLDAAEHNAHGSDGDHERHGGGQHGHARGGAAGVDHADYLMPDDVVAALTPEWVIEVHDIRPRTGPLPAEALHVEDIVLRARRRPPADAAGEDDPPSGG